MTARTTKVLSVPSSGYERITPQISEIAITPFKARASATPRGAPIVTTGGRSKNARTAVYHPRVELQLTRVNEVRFVRPHAEFGVVIVVWFPG
jgi:hypothetical protein